MKKHMGVFELMNWCNKYNIFISIDHGPEGIYVDMLDGENEDLPIQEICFELGEDGGYIEKILCEMATDIYVGRDVK